MLKKMVLIGMILLLCGCAAAIKESELFKHDSVYQDFGHLWFSALGYRNIDQQDATKSREYHWWGIPKYYPPADRRP